MGGMEGIGGGRKMADALRSRGLPVRTGISSDPVRNPLPKSSIVSSSGPAPTAEMSDEERKKYTGRSTMSKSSLLGG